MSSPPNDGCPRCLAFGHLGFDQSYTHPTGTTHVRINPDRAVTSILDTDPAASYHFRPCHADWFVTSISAVSTFLPSVVITSSSIWAQRRPAACLKTLWSGCRILRGFWRRVGGHDSRPSGEFTHPGWHVVPVSTHNERAPIPRSRRRDRRGSPNQGGRPVEPPRSNRPSKPANCPTPRLSSVTCHLLLRTRTANKIQISNTLSTT